MKPIFLWNSLAFSMIQQMLEIWSLVPLLFINSVWTSGSSQFMYGWGLAWRILSIILLVCEMIALVQYFEHSLALSFFGIGIKTDLFQSYGHCWVFQIFWHIECSTSTASSLAQLEFYLLTLLKICQGWNGAFSLPWKSCMDFAEVPLSFSPFLYDPWWWNDCQRMPISGERNEFSK